MKNTAVRSRCRELLIVAATVLVGMLSHAQTVRIANQGDAISMDPHSLAEALQLSLLGNVYESLVDYDKNLNEVPALATSWRQLSPTLWRFELRRNVRFHDGKPLTADDVIFSIRRAIEPTSDFVSLMPPIADIRQTAEFTIEIETKAPAPILPGQLSNVLVMSRKWAQDNQSTHAADKRKNIENPASFKANGTGPYLLRERQPALRTTFTRNPDYWGTIEGNAQEVVFTPIANDSTRMAALLSGEIDLMEPVPVQDVPRLMGSRVARALLGPELRTVFLGMDQSRNELPRSNVRGRNPFRDRRVRQAFYQAIDIQGIRRHVMHGASSPTALLVGPGIKGFDVRLNQRYPYDPAASRRLLAEAGYPNGFELGMDCPNDRYVSDSAICQAVAANLARVGVKVRLRTETKTTYFPRILNGESGFFMLGWTPVSFDSLNTLEGLTRCVDLDAGVGRYNLAGYCNKDVDRLIAAIQSESDNAKRNSLIGQAFEIVHRDIPYLPLHQQTLAWGARRNITVEQGPANAMMFRTIRVTPQ